MLISSYATKPYQTHKMCGNVCNVHKVASKGDIRIRWMQVATCERRDDGCLPC